MPAYRLLQEYFTLPQKFLFVDVAGLAATARSAGFDLLFLLRRAPRQAR